MLGRWRCWRERVELRRVARQEAGSCGEYTIHAGPPGGYENGCARPDCYDNGRCAANLKYRAFCHVLGVDP